MKECSGTMKMTLKDKEMISYPKQNSGSFGQGKMSESR